MGNWFTRLIGIPEQKSTIVGTVNEIAASFTQQRYDLITQESYLKNVIAFRCINLISRQAASVKWNVYTMKDGKEEPVENSPYKILLIRPNPSTGWTQFCEKVFAFLLMSGNSYIRKLGTITGGETKTAKQLEILRPDLMTADIDSRTGWVRQWIYTSSSGKTETFPVDPVSGKSEILHLKTFHPLDDVQGASTSYIAGREIDTANAGTDWNKKLLENDGKPGMIFTYKGFLGDIQKRELQSQLQSRYMGSNNAGKNILLEGDFSVAPFGVTAKDMDWLEGARDTARKICFAYGVPPQILGIPGDNTYSNYQEARLSLWEDTITYYLEYFKTELNVFLFGTADEFTGEYFDYSLDGVPALEIKSEKKWTRIQQADFLTTNEKRNELGFEPVEGGDDILIPSNLIPLNIGLDEDGGEEQPTGEEMPEEENPIEEELENEEEEVID